MRKLVSIKFGAHLYGTVTPASDLDFKSVHVPAPRDILLQRSRASVKIARQKAEKEKNLPGEVEEESYSLQRYLELVSEGQTVALDILFAPEWSMTESPSAEWREIIANRHRLLTRRAAAFVGYCRQQANKYGIKGSRVAAARSALTLLSSLVDQYGTTRKLGEFESTIVPAIAGVEHAVIVDIPLASGALIRHWNVCGRKLPFTASVKNARDVVQRLVDEYGQRALQAQKQQGVDWKALSHAVRVGTQAIEFLRTAHVTFPLPNADHILAIKTGQLPYQDVSREIEDLLEQVEAESAQSWLPERPDFAWIDEFVCRVYSREISGTDDIVSRAMAFATAAHGALNQRRKYTDDPYIVHPTNVARIVESVPHTPEMVAAAWLHDVVEDTEVDIENIRFNFGPIVADLVFWLTDISEPSDGNREMRKKIDRIHSGMAPAAAQTVKVADLIDNTASIEAHDKAFADVYCREKAMLLDVLTSADPTLVKQAREQVSRFEQAKVDNWLDARKWMA